MIEREVKRRGREIERRRGAKGGKQGGQQGEERRVRQSRVQAARLGRAELRREPWLGSERQGKKRGIQDRW